MAVTGAEVLLAVDLRDNSVQEAEMPASILYSHQDFTFTKYKDNQIIKFGGMDEQEREVGIMIRITVESFKRIISQS